jgi:hypothetical protein
VLGRPRAQVHRRSGAVQAAVLHRGAADVDDVGVVRAHGQALLDAALRQRRGPAASLEVGVEHVADEAGERVPGADADAVDQAQRAFYDVGVGRGDDEAVDEQRLAV